MSQTKKSLQDLTLLDRFLFAEVMEDAETFEVDNTENETRAEWYLRQIRGSSNFSGTEWLHILSGNLSHQIEHHLFPDMPANRYAEAAPKIRALCAEYGIHYNEASFMKQFGSVWVSLAKCSLPNHWSSSLTQSMQNIPLLKLPLTGLS